MTATDLRTSPAISSCGPRPPTHDPWGDAAWSKPAACNGGPGDRKPECGWRARRKACAAASRAWIRSRIASCPASGTDTEVNSPARCNRAKLAASRRSVLMRSLARLGFSDGAITTQSCPSSDNLTSDGVAAPAGLVAKPQPHSVTAELAHPPLHRRRRVDDPAILPPLASPRHPPSAAATTMSALSTSSPASLVRSLSTRLLCLRLGTGRSGTTLVTCVL